MICIFVLVVVFLHLPSVGVVGDVVVAVVVVMHAVLVVVVVGGGGVVGQTDRQTDRQRQTDGRKDGRTDMDTAAVQVIKATRPCRVQGLGVIMAYHDTTTIIVISATIFAGLFLKRKNRRLCTDHIRHREICAHA